MRATTLLLLVALTASSVSVWKEGNVTYIKFGDYIYTMKQEVLGEGVKIELK